MVETPLHMVTKEREYKKEKDAKKEEEKETKEKDEREEDEKRMEIALLLLQNKAEVSAVCYHDDIINTLSLHSFSPIVSSSSLPIACTPLHNAIFSKYLL